MCGKTAAVDMLWFHLKKLKNLASKEKWQYKNVLVNLTYYGINSNYTKSLVCHCQTDDVLLACVCPVWCGRPQRQIRK